jgi:hypothetical protein
MPDPGSPACPSPAEGHEAVPVFAVLGLGATGGEITRDLLDANVIVRAFDPAVDSPEATIACSD